MSNIITLELQAPPTTVKVLVDFYDDDEKKALQASPMRDVLTSLPLTLNIPTPDLCAYYLYYKKRPGVPRFTNHDEIAPQWANALVEFDGLIEFANDSLSLKDPPKLDSGTTERIGEAIGLSVSSELHSLHQADWIRIPPEHRRMTLDYWHPYVASDGRQFIQVETKGAAVPDNNRKRSAISNHKASIKNKKNAATAAERKTSVLYGTIAVLDNRPGTVARCWIVDPPANVPDNPRRFKIVNRLNYIANLVSLIAARSTLAAALQTRVSALNVLDDITPLNGQPLRRGDGGKFSMDYFSPGGGRNPLFQSKSVVAAEPVGGQVSVVSNTIVLFTGIQERLVVLASQQDFDEIAGYAFPFGIKTRKVHCVLSRGRFDSQFAKRMRIPDGERRDSGGYVSFDMTGQLYYTKGGFVYGLLPIPEAWRLE